MKRRTLSLSLLAVLLTPFALLAAPPESQAPQAASAALSAQREEMIKNFQRINLNTAPADATQAFDDPCQFRPLPIVELGSRRHRNGRSSNWTSVK